MYLDMSVSVESQAGRSGRRCGTLLVEVAAVEVEAAVEDLVPESGEKLRSLPVCLRSRSEEGDRASLP